MASPKKDDKPTRRSPPARTPEARENQMIAKAMALAEQKLNDGTASSQIIVEYIRRGSAKERLENEMRTEQVKLIRAKTQAIESEAKSEERYNQAIEAMKMYGGYMGGSDD